MRARVLFSSLLALVILFSPQSKAQVASGSAAEPSLALEDLQGNTISLVLNFAIRFRMEGGTYQGELIRRLRAQLKEQGAITTATARETYAGGQVHVLKRKFEGFIGRPGKSSEGEDLVWLYENNVLSAFTVLEVGAASNVITLKKGPAALECTAKAPPMREVGAGNMKSQGRAKSEKIEILDMTLKSATCRVQATKLVKDNDGFWTPKKAPAAPRSAGVCTPCLTRCSQCGMSQGTVCFQACQSKGNPMVRSDSACGQKFTGCGL